MQIDNFRGLGDMKRVFEEIMEDKSVKTYFISRYARIRDILLEFETLKLSRFPQV